MTDLNVALHNLNDAQATHREAAEFLKSTEDQVVATATLTKDERLPSAVSSPGYKPALNTIIQEAHNDELLDDVKAHNDTRERMEVWSLTAEQANQPTKRTQSASRFAGGDPDRNDNGRRSAGSAHRSDASWRRSAVLATHRRTDMVEVAQ